MANPTLDPTKFRGTMSDLAFGTVLNAAARNLKQELLTNGKETRTNDEIDVEDLMDDPELQRLHAERIMAMKEAAEKRAALHRKGHGEYRQIDEEDFLPEVTGSQRVVVHFHHREFIRCKIMDKHLQLLAPKHLGTKFVKIDAEKCPFFVAKLNIKVLPCVILFRNGIAADRIVGFEELGGVDDFATSALESRLTKAGVIEKERREGEEDEERESSRNIRSSAHSDSDSD